MDSITYVANAGVLLRIGGRKILVDALTAYPLSFYRATPEELRRQIIQGVPPFDGVDLMLVTHGHRDHFHGESTGKFLLHHPETAILSGEDVVAAIRDHVPGSVEGRLFAISQGGKTFVLNGVEVTAIPMRHAGREHERTPNTAFLIRCGLTVLCPGDAAPEADNFQVPALEDCRIGVMVANFPYVGLPGAREMVLRHIRPGRMFVVHLPDPAFDEFGWTAAAKKAYARVRDVFVPAVFLEEPGVAAGMDGCVLPPVPGSR